VSPDVVVPPIQNAVGPIAGTVLGNSLINLVGPGISMPPLLAAFIPVPPVALPETGAVGLVPLAPPEVPPEVVQAPAVVPPAPEAPVAVVPPAPEQTYVPPVRARKPDRN
jgi:hypothetical protein